MPNQARSIRIAPSADADLQDAYRFYEDQQVGIGGYFLDSLIADIDSLAFSAGMHPQYAGFYRLLAKRFPFAIYYEFDGDTAYVAAVLDCRQNPKSIVQRLLNDR